MNPVVLVRFGGAFLGGVVWGLMWSGACDKWIEPAMLRRGRYRPDAVRYRPIDDEAAKEPVPTDADRLAAIDDELNRDAP